MVGLLPDRTMRPRRGKSFQETAGKANPKPEPSPKSPRCRLDREREHLPSGLARRLAGDANNVDRSPRGQTPSHSPLASKDILCLNSLS